MEENETMGDFVEAIVYLIVSAFLMVVMGFLFHLGWNLAATHGC